MENRLVLVVNPRSSGFTLVYDKIIRHIDDLNIPKSQKTTYEIQPTNPLDNAQKMAKLLQDNDVIFAAGGDGTAHIATNAAFLSGKKNLKIKYTGFGNFNDYALSFSRGDRKHCLRALKEQKPVATLTPMEITINGQFFRYAPLYATIGLTGEMADIFEHPKVRGLVKKSPGRNSRLIMSLSAATRFYFKNRRHKTLPPSTISVDDKPQTPPKHTTDLVFMNGPRMARIMRSKQNRQDSTTFGFTALDSEKLIRNTPFLTKGLFGYIPLTRAKQTEILFETPNRITIQIEGETETLTDIKSLKVKLTQNSINVL